MLDKIEKLKQDPFYKRYFLKFKKADFDYMNSFVIELEKMSREDAIQAIAYSAMKADKPNNWTAIEEILSIAVKSK